jgi:hypothetical protein
VDFLQRAIQSIGRTPPGKRAAVVAWIKKRAAALGRTDLVKNLANELKAIELAGVPGGSPESPTPQVGTKKQALPKTKNTSQFQSQLKPGNLKTRAGKVAYAKLRAQGYPHSLSLQAAKKHEQGLLTGEMSNVHELAAYAGPAKFQNDKATKAYQRAKKKGLPEKMARMAGKFIDKKMGPPKDVKATNDPKA